MAVRFIFVAETRDAHDRKIDPLVEELFCVPVLEDLRLLGRLP
jgi:hypothetical protein